MQVNLEQIIEGVRALPFEDLNRLREERERKQIDEAKQIKLQIEITKFKKAEKWLAENREKYMNEWVCLVGDRLIAHGTDALEVHQKAVEAGIEIPYLEHIVEESDWGGW